MNEKENKSTKTNNGTKKTVRTVIIAVLVIIMIVSGVFVARYIYGVYNAENDKKQLESLTSEQTTETLAENPIDFTSLKQQNDEIYAWIKIPGTDIDYPVCRSKKDDNFYLRHSALNKKWSDAGAIYTQSMNDLEFNDPITVMYGHNGYAQTMFTDLHRFEKEEFFKENQYFYVYTENRKLTYSIVSAFKYDNRHILNSFNFEDKNVLKDFQQMLLEPKSMSVNVRENTTIADDAKILILSTCYDKDKSVRLLVNGVLIKDEKTK